MPNALNHPCFGSSEAAEPYAEQCMRCDGCGQIADTEDGEPWSMWAEMPPESQTAVLLGLVNPVACPDCGGAGIVHPETTRGG